MRRMYSEGQIKKLAGNKIRLKYEGGYGDINIRLWYVSLKEHTTKDIILKDEGEELYLENVSEIEFVAQQWGGAEIDIYGGCFAYHDSQTPVISFPGTREVATNPDVNVGTNIIVTGDAYIYVG